MAARTLKPRHQDDVRANEFYVYEILNENKNVIYVGKGINKRVFSSLKEKCGSYYRIVKYFEYEHAAFNYEKAHILKFNGLLNKNKGGAGGCVLNGDARFRLISEIGTKAYSARLLIKYYLSFIKLSKANNNFYSNDVKEVFNSLDIKSLYLVGYGLNV